MNTPASAQRRRTSQSHHIATNSTSNISRITSPTGFLNSNHEEDHALNSVTNVQTHQDLLQSLQEITLSTMNELESIWERVGMHNMEDRSHQTMDLIAQIRHVCEEKVRIEKNVEQQFETSIQHAKGELLRLSKALNVRLDLELEVQDPDDGTSEVLGSNHIENVNYENGIPVNKNSNNCLTDELSHLETHLENLREVAGFVEKDLVDMKSQIMEIQGLLMGDDSNKNDNDKLNENEEEWWHDTRSDLTNEYRERMRDKLREMEEQVCFI